MGQNNETMPSEESKGTCIKTCLNSIEEKGHRLKRRG